jgi:predicted TIM-barrel fold metal-dependent hydrolase
MIIDASAHLGPYPFRSLRDTTAPQMIARLDRLGLAAAVVSSLPAVFYRDGHRGNAELRAQLQPYRDRLFPIATINPRYADWEHCLEEAVKAWGMKAVALAPDHHGYRLADEPGRQALALIAALGVPVVLTQRLEDRRERHAWDQAEDLREAELLAAAQAHPKLRIFLRNWVALDGRKLADAGLKGRCLLDFARLSVVHTKEVPKLIDALGIEAVAFGTHAPFDYAGPSLVKLANLEARPKAEFEKIAGRNAAAFFGLSV